jgi:membrane associated rhomboid family serine protease
VFIPLQHENNQGRRWPVVTIALVLLNLAIFLATHWRMEQISPQATDLRVHILMLAAMHPELSMPTEVQDYVETFKRESPGLWREAQSQTREVADAWDAKIRLMEDPAALQREMDSLCSQFSEIKQSSIPEQYGFIPAHPTLLSYLTANFLHGGWLHLIGNMWFLWLAGCILEDTWGRVIYPIFYLVAGAAALQFHAWLNPTSTIPTIGASGAIAAVMGAFLVRFPTTKIEVAVVLGPRSIANLAMGNGLRFKAAAYWLLPMWLLMEIFSGALFGQQSGVAHWAHVGGFVFGAIFAVALRYSGLEHHANKAIEAKVTWSADENIVNASELMEKGKLDEAIAALQLHLASKPESLEAYSLLSQLYWRKNDISAFREAVVKTCQLHLKAHDLDAALQDYDEFTSSGGEVLPADVWLELCRALEGKEDLERAVAEYEKLAMACPAERQSILALLAAGRLSMKRLNRPGDALRFYEAASSSKVPHLDWESNIQAGINAAQKALATVSS